MTDKSYYAMREMMIEFERGEDALAELCLTMDKSRNSDAYSEADKKAFEYLEMTVERNHREALDAAARKFVRTYMKYDLGSVDDDEGENSDSF